MSDVGTRSRPHCKLPLESERLNRASRVHGAAQTRSLAYQAAGVARFGTTKAAISTCREHRPACRSPSTREDAPLDTRACEDAGPGARAPHGGMHAGGQEGWRRVAIIAATPSCLPPCAPVHPKPASRKDGVQARRSAGVRTWHMLSYTRRATPQVASEGCGTSLPRSKTHE